MDTEDILSKGATQPADLLGRPVEQSVGFRECIGETQLLTSTEQITSNVPNFGHVCLMVTLKKVKFLC